MPLINLISMSTVIHAICWGIRANGLERTLEEIREVDQKRNWDDTLAPQLYSGMLEAISKFNAEYEKIKKRFNIVGIDVVDVNVKVSPSSPIKLRLAASPFHWIKIS